MSDTDSPAASTLVEKLKEASFRPTREAEALHEEIRDAFGFRFKYETARLAIGRSLAHSDSKLPVPEPDGTGIRGRTLFEHDIDAWVATLIQAGGIDNPNPNSVRLEAEAHWARGASLLREDWEGCGGDTSVLLQALAGLLPNRQPGGVADGGSNGVPRPGRAPGEISVPVGPVSQHFETGEPIVTCLNGPSNSPHIALMGRSGTGKSYTGNTIILDIVREANVPFLFIDPKGQFVDDGGGLERPFDDPALGVSLIRAGEDSIPLDFLPRPDIGQARFNQACARFRDSVLAACRSPGDTQRIRLLNAVEEVAASENRDLASLRDTYEGLLKGARADSVLARLDEVSRTNTFVPEASDEEFFSQSWVISLGMMQSEESRNLLMFLLIDALAAYRLSQPDSPASARGHRTLTHVFAIDEAHRILRQPRLDSLSNLLRQGRSKGQVVVLFSQNPSDFQQQDEDFMSQLGTVVAFPCSAGTRGLRLVRTAFNMTTLMQEELSDTYLEPGVALVKRPQQPATRVRCWAASD